MTDAEIYALLTDEPYQESKTSERIIWANIQRRYARDIAFKEAFTRFAGERAKLQSVLEAAKPLVEWLEAAVPGCQRLNSPNALVGPSQVKGRDVGLTVDDATKLLAALKEAL